MSAEPHPDDDLHVITDALGELLDSIDRGEVSPWSNYDADDTDAKTTRDGYLSVLNRARSAVERELSRSDGYRFSTPTFVVPEGTTAVCVHCSAPILLDQREGGGPGFDWGASPDDWTGNGGVGMDYGCDMSPDTDADGCGGHSPEWSSLSIQPGIRP